MEWDEGSRTGSTDLVTVDVMEVRSSDVEMFFAELERGAISEFRQGSMGNRDVHTHVW